MARKTRPKYKRWGSVGSSWNSKKYWHMRNDSISNSLKAYHARKRLAKNEKMGLVEYILVGGFFLFLVVAAIYNSLP